METKQFSKSILLAGALFATASFSSNSYAWGKHNWIQPLSGADTVLSTYLSKSRISGELRKENGYLVTDSGEADGNFFFDFTGNTYVPVTNPGTGKLLATMGPNGTVSGTALFPPEFASLAFAAYGAMTGGPALDPAAIPASIHWQMDNITIVQGGTTYVPIPSGPEEMGLDGRAFTGLGPVEMGQIEVGVDGDGVDMSMSVRMGGCFAVMATEGVEAGKIGTYCLNSTFTFDLSGIIYSPDPMVAATSSITGIGTSNCTTVLHTPMQMPE